MRARLHFGFIPFIGFGIEKEYHGQHIVTVDFPFFFVGVGFGEVDKMFRFWNEIPARFKQKGSELNPVVRQDNYPGATY